MSQVKRKKPQQARSAATVEALLSAASQVVARDGIEGFSTTAVAERAGVSIGSLYQYFANKDDLLVAMARSELAGLLGSVATAFAESMPGTRTRAVVSTIIRGVTPSSVTRPELHLLLQFAGRPPLSTDIAAFAARLAPMVGAVGDLSPEATFVLARAVLGVVSSVPGAADELDRKRIEDELVNLIGAFITSRPKGG